MARDETTILKGLCARLHKDFNSLCLRILVPVTGSPIRTRFVFALIPCSRAAFVPARQGAGSRDMSAVSARPERLVPTTPSVTHQVGQDGVILAAAGAWIVAAGRELEAAGASLISSAKDAKRVILDLSALQRMDTAGAWFIDRARVELTASGANFSYRGARPEHATLLQDAGYHAAEAPTRLPPSHGIALLSAVGETVAEFGRRFHRHRRLSR